MRVVLRRVHKSFAQKGQRVQVLHDVNFSIEEGEFVCVIGPSGCGKSTLISLIAGLEFPDSGQVFVDSKVVEGPSRDRLVVFQEAALFPWLTVLENVEFGLKIAGVAQQERRERALEAVKGRLEFMLSGGLTADTVATAARLTGAWAVDVSSGVESRPGEKDLTLIRAFLAAAKTA